MSVVIRKRVPRRTAPARPDRPADPGGPGDPRGFGDLGDPRGFGDLGDPGGSGITAAFAAASSPPIRASPAGAPVPP